MGWVLKPVGLEPWPSTLGLGGFWAPVRVCTHLASICMPEKAQDSIANKNTMTGQERDCGTRENVLFLLFEQGVPHFYFALEPTN